MCDFGPRSQRSNAHSVGPPTPRILAIAVHDSVAGAPFAIHAFITGTPIGVKEMDFGRRDAAIVFLTELWVKAAEPTPCETLGSIVCVPFTFGDGMSRRDDGDRVREPRFRAMPMIPARPDDNIKLVDPSEEGRTGPRTVSDLEKARRDIAETYLNHTPQADQENDAEEPHPDRLWQCVNGLRELVDIAAALDPLDHPKTALLHKDFASLRNVFFSENCIRIEAFVDQDDAVIVARDRAAI